MFLRSVFAVCAGVFMVTYISPQLGFYGRGLRVGLPAFCLAVAAAFMANPSLIIATLNRHKWIFVLGGLFVFQAAIRFGTLESIGVSTANVVPVYITGVIQVLMGVFLILLALAFGNSTIRLVCHIVLVGGAVSLCLGIPVLLERPGVARDVMRMSMMGYARLEYRSGEGVGTFTQYTGVAVAFFPMMLWLIESKGLCRWLYAPLMAGVAVAVFISTFTMASLFLAAGATAGVVYWLLRNKVMMVPKALLLALAGFLAFGVIVAAASGNKAFMFAYDKATLMWERVSSSGVVQGDQTGRGEMLAADVEQFLCNPLVGPIGGVTSPYLGHGHSSLTNTFVVNGVLGASLWVGALFLIFRVCVANAGNRLIKTSAWFCGTLLFASGIVNPTWHFPAISVTTLLFLAAFAGSPDEQIASESAESLWQSQMFARGVTGSLGN